VGVADEENAPGNLITRIWKNKDHFPTTVSHGQSQSVVRFKKKGRLEVLMSFFDFATPTSGLDGTDFRFFLMAKLRLPQGHPTPLTPYPKRPTPKTFPYHP
jgi:hypothetical protein